MHNDPLFMIIVWYGVHAPACLIRLPTEYPYSARISKAYCTVFGFPIFHRHGPLRRGKTLPDTSLHQHLNDRELIYFKINPTGASILYTPATHVNTSSVCDNILDTALQSRTRSKILGLAGRLSGVRYLLSAGYLSVRGGAYPLHS